jgi:hypothetical protein
MYKTAMCPCWFINVIMLNIVFPDYLIFKFIIFCYYALILHYVYLRRSTYLTINGGNK